VRRSLGFAAFRRRACPPRRAAAAAAAAAAHARSLPCPALPSPRASPRSHSTAVVHVSPLSGGMGAGAGGSPPPPLPPPPPPGGAGGAPTARTLALARKVAAAKAERLSCCEWLCIGLGCLSTLPLLGLPNLRVVPPNTRLAVFRFGKLAATVRAPGLTCVLPCGVEVQSFSGAQTHKMDSLHVVDASGNPILVRAMLEYAVDDPAALQIAANGSLYVLFNMAEQVVREACGHLPLVGERGADIRSQSQELALAMAADLQPDASVLGVSVLRLIIVEARYAPEIAATMLAKQGAAAMVAARKEIVAGALLIVRDTLAEFPQLGDASRDRLVSNLLVSLTSHAPATPVLPLAA